MNVKVMSDNQMLQEITQDMRALRKRIDGHIDDQVDRLVKISDDISKIQIDMAGHKGKIETKVGMIAAGISVLTTGAVAWVVKHWGA